MIDTPTNMKAKYKHVKMGNNQKELSNVKMFYYLLSQSKMSLGFKSHKLHNQHNNLSEKNLKISIVIYNPK